MRTTFPANPFVVTDVCNTDVGCPLDQRCVEVLSVITAVLEPGDNPDVVANVIVMGIEDNVADGGLFAALPASTVYVYKGAEPTVGPTTTLTGQPVVGPMPAPTRGPATGSAPPTAAARLTKAPTVPIICKPLDNSSKNTD